MNAREGFVLACRLLAIYYLIGAIVDVVQEFVYVAGLSSSQEGTPHRILPHLAIPTVFVFAAIFLWFKSPKAAEKMFIVRTAEPPARSSDMASRTLTRLFGLYFVIGGVAGTADFIVSAIFGTSRYSDVLRGSSWSELASCIVWISAGLLVYFGTSRIIGAMRRMGDTVANELWRIKPDDDPDSRA